MTACPFAGGLGGRGGGVIHVQREIGSVSGGKEAGPCRGAQLRVIVPGKFWGSAEEMEGERDGGRPALMQLGL